MDWAMRLEAKRREREPTMIRAFERACSDANNITRNDDDFRDTTDAFAYWLKELAQDSAVQTDSDSSRRLIKFAVSAFDTGGGIIVMNEVLFEILDPLQACCRASSDASRDFNTFIEKVAAKCNPDEALMQFLATLMSAER